MQEISKHNGNIRYYINDYGFKTPSQTASPVPPATKVTNIAVPSVNRFDLLQDSDIHDDRVIHNNESAQETDVPPSLLSNVSPTF